MSAWLWTFRNETKSHDASLLSRKPGMGWLSQSPNVKNKWPFITYQSEWYQSTVMQPNGWPRAAVAFVVAHLVCVSNPEFQLYEHVRGVKIKQQKEKKQQEARLMIERLPCLLNTIGIFDTCASENLLRAQAKPESATCVSDFLRLYSDECLSTSHSTYINASSTSLCGKFRPETSQSSSRSHLSSTLNCDENDTFYKPVTIFTTLRGWDKLPVLYKRNFCYSETCCC